MIGKTILEIKGVTKSFSGVTALKDMNFDLREAEIHAIVGENGAGKSTLCNILTGVFPHDAGKGEIFLFGKKVEFKSPSEAIDAGISMVYQERNLIDFLTGAQNICLGAEPKKGVVIDEKKIQEIADELSEKLGIAVPLDVPVEELGAGAKQLIEIIRALYQKPKLLILDEPTASLGSKEIDAFLALIKDIAKKQKISIIFISHKLEEVYAVSDRISVLVEGTKVRTEDTDKMDVKTCISSMLKKDKLGEVPFTQQERTLKPVLKVGNCVYDGKEHKLNFEVYENEVVGFYGLVGSGRTECAEVIFGIRNSDKNEIELDGEKITNPTPAKMIEKGLIMTPEIRINAMFPEETITTNASVLFLKKLSSKVLGLMNVHQMESFSESILEKNGVKYDNTDQHIRELSGGNIQKVIIGRSLEIEKFKLIIMDEPTNGLDLGAKNDVYIKTRALVENQHKAVLFISSEIEELLKVCDRIYVFYEGSIEAEFERKSWSKESVLRAAFNKGRGGKVE